MNVRAAGQMTLAMRAVEVRAVDRREGSRVLRIGVVQGGRVVDERVLKRRAHVTIGPNPRDTFVTGGSESVLLFEAVGDRYVLNVPRGTAGRLATSQGLVDLAEAERQGRTRIELDDVARGKIVIGDVGLLFQLVTPAPLLGKPQLPLATSGGRVDWSFTVIAAFSFLVHFGLAGAVNSDWFDPRVDDGAETASLIEQAANRAVAPMEEKVETAERNDAVKPAPEPAAPRNERSFRPTPGPATPGPSSPAPTKDPVALSKALDSIGLRAVGVFTETGPAQSNLFKKGETAVDGSLDKVAEKTDGVATGSKLDLPGGGTGPTGPIGAGGSALSGKWNVTKSEKTVAVADKSSEVKAPGVVSAQPSQGASNVKDVDGVIARNRWRLKGCYDRALAIDPNAGGTVRVTVRVGEGGDVTSANATSSDAPAALTQCIGSAFAAMKFAAPEGGVAQFTAPIVLSTPKK